MNDQDFEQFDLFNIVRTMSKHPHGNHVVQSLCQRCALEGTEEQKSQIESLKSCLEGFRSYLDEPIFNKKPLPLNEVKQPKPDLSEQSVVTDVSFGPGKNSSTHNQDSLNLDRYDQLTEEMASGFELLRERMNSDYQTLKASVDNAESRDFQGFIVSISVFIIISALLLQWAQKQISVPIVNIAREARAAITEEHSYSGFDKGSSEVQQLNRTLTDLINSHENMVSSRTKQLSEQTDTLKQEICKRIAAETELRSAMTVAETASRAKSSFLAMMSHEIRTPMNGVVGFTDLLLDTNLNDQQREYGHTVKSSAESLLRILNDILDFSKIESGKLDFERAPFSLLDIIEESTSLLGARAKEKNLDLAITSSDELPLQFVGDSTRVRQILINLIGNAIKFTSEGTVTIDVLGEKTTRSEGASPIWKIECSVTDTGVGMAPELQAQLFNPFSQGDASVTRRFGGTGLGLAICKRLVEMMDGDIVAISEPGYGSTFRFHVHLPTATEATA
ncbi:MAG: hypothetical protein HOI66_10505 [Verrucomicrobia bacterium]|nr:hypothetical protein [Verrucomicrobiota bacterium]